MRKFQFDTIEYEYIIRPFSFRFDTTKPASQKRISATNATAI